VCVKKPSFVYTQVLAAMGGAVNDEDIAALMVAADSDRDGQVGGSGIVVSMWRSFLCVCMCDF
jgi:hypothetical protein